MKILTTSAHMAVDTAETAMVLGAAEPQMVCFLYGTITGCSMELYSICYRNEVASSSVSDV
jgi:hypothetical protein